MPGAAGAPRGNPLKLPAAPPSRQQGGAPHPSPLGTNPPNQQPDKTDKKAKKSKKSKKSKKNKSKKDKSPRKLKSITRNLASRVLPRHRVRVGPLPPLPAREFFAMLRDAARVQVNKSSSTTQSGILVAWLVRRCKCGTRCPLETVAKQNTRRQACRRVPADFS